MNKTMRYRLDGTFKIVQFTDLHWKNGDQRDRRTQALMERIIMQEKPDLIVFTGDVIESLRCKDPIQSFRNAIAVAEGSGIPWVSIFGNHDCEQEVTKEQLMKVQLEYVGSLAEAGPPEVDGVGNFIVRVSDSHGEVAAALYFLDSGDYSALPSVRGYDWIRNSQVNWFRSQSRELQQQHGGVPVPSLAFFHIPLPEYRQVWNYNTCYGHRYEKVHAPMLNSGLFAAMVESGGVMGTFCGHDHTNDYIGELNGIRLCYGRCTGYNTYGRLLYPKGARVIQLKLREGFTTWLRLANGRIAMNPRRHFPNWFSRV
ncbi:metallophosphoesterase family protein [Cohnella silvisoli]|uniref:Metallophosphoesterase family protein n=1 Tax=Cohnella silvisoli TaxID=2873699 RepID=A0ABV1L0V2_9BACL|nr:metallophosphoesterase family protein [Cohnella silvisoli]MCD9024886.1 metallophosphoesterase family protein [Cohnella silvisoli]